MTTLECLYYPYSRTLNLNTIKKGILLFNKVQFLDTQPWLIRKALLRTDRRGWHPKTLDRVWSEYDFLRQEGLIEIIDPSDFVKQNGTLITRSVASDILDDDFLKIAAHEKTKWQILRDRLPRDFVEITY